MSDVTAPLVVGTIAVVGVGTAITANQVNAKAIVAAGIMALGLSALANADETLAEVFAGLIFVGACYKFVPAIVEELGYSGGRSGNPIDLKEAKAKAGREATGRPRPALSLPAPAATDPERTVTA